VRIFSEDKTKAGNQQEKLKSNLKIPGEQKAEMIVTIPEDIPTLLHEKKWEILHILIDHEKTIRQLSVDLKINPGTIKRFILDLENRQFIEQSRKIKNEYGITLKFYRATAKKYIIHLELP